MSRRTQWLIICGAFEIAGVILLLHEQTWIAVFGAWMLINGTVGINSTLLTEEPKGEDQ
jgi:hypothetical protein